LIILSGRHDISVKVIGTIKPIVKYYFVEGTKQEQVILDSSFSITDGIIDCYNNTSVELVCEVK